MPECGSAWTRNATRRSACTATRWRTLGCGCGGFVEREDRYTVTYHIGRQRHISTVRKDDLTVLTCGICLSGRDSDFDLTSLVSVP